MNELNYNNLYKDIRHYKYRLNVSKEQFSKEIGVSATTIHKIESCGTMTTEEIIKNGKEVKFYILSKICNYANLDIKNYIQ